MAEYAITAHPVLTPPLTPPIYQASLSREPPQEAPTPRLLHTLHQEQSSVLSVAADDKHIFSGSQGYDIYVWDRRTFNVTTTLRGHMGSVLALEVAKDKGWLFSSSGDSTVRIWCTTSLLPLYVLNPYLDNDSGDLFSITYSNALQTLYIGCQNTSLQWFDFSGCSITHPHPHAGSESQSTSRTRSVPISIADADNAKKLQRHKFFDSSSKWEGSSSKDGSSSGQATPTSSHGVDIPQPLGVLQVPATNVVDAAHYGYVYSMVLLSPQDGEGVLLATGSGDETMKLWLCTSSGVTLVHTFEGCEGAVLSLVARGETVFAGCQEGVVKVWDLETKTLVRTIIAQEGVDILSLSLNGTDLYACSANGQVQRWSATFDCTASWHAHDGIVLSSIVTRCTTGGGTSWRLVTGANDNCIKLWDIEGPTQRRPSVSIQEQLGDGSDLSGRAVNDTMIYALSKLVSIPSVSNSPPNREDCRQAAIWLKKCLTQLGAKTTMLPTAEGINPLVLATFHGSQSKQNRPRVLFYGHYDVISAPREGWSSDPFTLTGKNGYFYGRGTTDNKGPILAVACAASELLGRRALGCDLVLLIEGEEEAGSIGFSDAVKRHKDLIGNVDAILVSNSTWIAEDRPCITYGLRGVVHSSVEISSNQPDLHSGIEGGAVIEPMMDMVKLLATLSEGQKVLIPGFYDQVRPQTDEEKKLYQLLSTVTHRPASSISSRWREPSLSIHSLEVSGPGNATVIPATVKAKVSLRIVPDQDLDAIARALSEYISTSFVQLQSPNRLRVSIDHTADWWLGSLDDPWFKALENAVREEWGVEPLRIREGGSIPSVPYLEKEFGCHALHLPLGQSSDQAHLPNERISLVNLRRGKSVVERFLLAISK